MFHNDTENLFANHRDLPCQCYFTCTFQLLVLPVATFCSHARHFFFSCTPTSFCCQQFLQTCCCHYYVRYVIAKLSTFFSPFFDLDLINSQKKHTHKRSLKFLSKSCLKYFVLTLGMHL